jgi:hypothetical protein
MVLQPLAEVQELLTQVVAQAVHILAAVLLQVLLVVQA